MSKYDTNKNLTPTSRFMQSFEKVAVLKDAQTPSAVTSTVTHDGSPIRRLALAGLPVALIALWCVTAFAGRALDSAFHKKDYRVIAANAQQAKAAAGSLLTVLTDNSVSMDELQFSKQTAFSVNRNRTMDDWSVVYGSESGRQYLIRLNSITHQIYGVNRIKPETEPLAIARPAGRQMTAQEAQLLALRYLEQLGTNIDSLTLIPDSMSSDTGDSFSSGRPGDRGYYTFSYRRRISESGDRLLKVTIDRVTGELEYYWNPSAAI